jgi:cytochrome c553
VSRVTFSKRWAAASAAAFLLSSPAFAAKGDIEAGRAKAAEFCAACHGENGWSEMEGVPNLAGNADLFLQWQLVYFRNERRISEIMKPVAAELTDAEIRNLGAYYASLPPVASPATSDPKPALTEAGKAAAETHRCASCHGDGFLGLRAAARIANQREDYLVKALADYRANKRPSTAAGAMNDAAASLEDDEIAAISHFLARLPAAAP